MQGDYIPFICDMKRDVILESGYTICAQDLATILYTYVLHTNRMYAAACIYISCSCCVNVLLLFLLRELCESCADDRIFETYNFSDDRVYLFWLESAKSSL